MADQATGWGRRIGALEAQLAGAQELLRQAYDIIDEHAPGETLWLDAVDAS